MSLYEQDFKAKSSQTARMEPIHGLNETATYTSPMILKSGYLNDYKPYTVKAKNATKVKNEVCNFPFVGNSSYQQNYLSFGGHSALSVKMPYKITVAPGMSFMGKTTYHEHFMKHIERKQRAMKKSKKLGGKGAEVEEFLNVNKIKRK